MPTKGLTGPVSGPGQLGGRSLISSPWALELGYSVVAAPLVPGRAPAAHCPAGAALPGSRDLCEMGSYCRHIPCGLSGRRAGEDRPRSVQGGPCLCCFLLSGAQGPRPGCCPSDGEEARAPEGGPLARALGCSPQARVQLFLGSRGPQEPGAGLTGIRGWHAAAPAATSLREPFLQGPMLAALPVQTGFFLLPFPRRPRWAQGLC